MKEPNIFIKSLAPSILASLLFVCSSCGTFAGNPDDLIGEGEKPSGSSSSGGVGNFKGINIALTDAPIDELAHVYITIASLSIRDSQEAWANIPLSDNEEIDLLTLQDGKFKLLGGLDEPAEGTYSETRLLLSEEQPPRAKLASGDETKLKLPSGSTSGLKIKEEFTYDGTKLDLVIDFDLRKSIISSGKNGYQLKPVLRLVKYDDAGTIEGKNAPAESLICAIKATNNDEENTCEEAVNSVHADAEGNFTIPFLPAGAYVVQSTIEDQVDNYAGNVTVEAGKKVKITWPTADLKKGNKAQGHGKEGHKETLPRH